MRAVALRYPFASQPAATPFHEPFPPHPRPTLLAFARPDPPARRGAARHGPAADGPGRPAAGPDHHGLRSRPEAPAAHRASRRADVRRQRPRRVGGGHRQPARARPRGAGPGHRALLRILGPPDRGAGLQGAAHAVGRGPAHRCTGRGAGTARRHPTRDRGRVQRAHRHRQRRHQRPAGACARPSMPAATRRCSSWTWWPRWAWCPSTWMRCAPTW